MSAFMVNDEIINSIISGLKYAEEWGDGYAKFPRDPGNDLLCVSTPEQAQELGARLFHMNILGIEARYGKGDAKTFRPLDYAYASIPHPNIYQLFKSIRCLLYQCMEGDVPEEQPLYNALLDWSKNIAVYALEKSDKYQAAAWG